MNRNGKPPTLRIYVGKHCWACEEALRLGDHLRKKFLGLSVEIIDLDSEDSVNYDHVFSTPTYVFNGRTISLGNPTCEDLVANVSDLLA